MPRPGYSTQRRCGCGGNPQCPQCGGRGVINLPPPIMSGPAGVRRRLPVSRLAAPVTPSFGPPEPKRCPHCNFDVLDLAAHIAESHPDQQVETEADRAAREAEAARQAQIAAEIARREAEAAQRKAEARARRQAIEGLEPPAPAEPVHTAPLPRPAAHPVAVAPPVAAADPQPAPPAEPAPAPPREATGRPDERWERLQRAAAERTVLRGVVRSCKPFGIFVDVGGVDGLVPARELRAEQSGGVRQPQVGQALEVVVLAVHEERRRVELGLPREPKLGPARAPAPRGEARAPQGPMALAFRLALEKKQQGE